jgi:hypothetical protein
MMLPSKSGWCTPLFSAALFAAVGVASGCAPKQTAAPRPYAVALARAPGKAVGTRLVVRPGTIVILDANESGLTSPGGAADAAVRPDLAFRWRQTAGPEVRLARNDMASVELRVVDEGFYRFEVVASAGEARSLPSEVEIEVSARAPAPAPVSLPGTSDPAQAAEPRGANFALLETDLGDLVRVFPVRTGLTLRVDEEWLRPEEFRERPLSLMARNVTPAAALEMAARLAGPGAAFVRDGRDSAMLVAGYGWLRREPQEAHFYPVPASFAPADGSELTELVRASCRAALIASPDFSIQWRADPAGVQAVGPASMHRRIRAALEAFSADPGAPPAEPPKSADERRREEVLIKRIDLHLVDAELFSAALEFGRTLGVPVAWEEPSKKESRLPAARVSVSSRGRPAAEVLAEIEKGAGFKGHSWVAGGGIWLWRTEPRAGSAEHLWNQAVVRVYPLKWLEDKGVLPRAVVHVIKGRVRPETWSDPATLCVYHQASDRLLVIAAPDVQDEVVRLMHRLADAAAARKPAEKPAPKN